MEEHGESKLELAGYDKMLGDPDYHHLKQLTSLDVHQMLKRYMSKLHHQLDEAHAGRKLSLEDASNPLCCNLCHLAHTVPLTT